MHNINIVKDMLKAGVYNEQLQNIYNCTDSETEFYAKRYIRVIDNFESTFGKKESIALLYTFILLWVEQKSAVIIPTISMDVL